MIALYLIFGVFGLVVYFVLGGRPFRIRLIISFMAFAIPCIGLTLILLLNGDKPTHGSRVISKEELEREGKGVGLEK
jgi:hypothetical protein